MKKRIPIIAGILVFLAGIFLTINFFFRPQQIDEVSDLINISELSEEFMDEYFDGMAELSKNYDDENILLVVSTKDIKDSFGAKSVVKAPNNTYILGYENKSAKLAAKKSFEAADDIYSVTENRQYTINEGEGGNYNSWGIEKMGLDYAADLINGHGGENVTAAIIDTGCDIDLFNASFSGKILETYNLYETETYGNGAMFDSYGHGTHIAGTIAEGTPDNVKILPIKVSDGQYLNTADILSAINYITYNHKADVINMSFGSSGYTIPDFSADPEYIAIEAAKAENIISVAAAGNDGDDASHYPSGFDNTISISAVDSNLVLADFSSYGEPTTFTAPGVAIKSINGIYSGTSMATPHAVSAVTVLKSLNKGLSFDAVIDVLSSHVDDLGPKSKDIYFGHGFINLSDVLVCENPSSQDCDDYEIFREIHPASITVEEAILTPYNYGSITNFLATEVKITSSDGSFLYKRLDDLDSLVISDYDPYLSTEQTVNISYLGHETSFTVTNPANYELGWQYSSYSMPSPFIAITGYTDNLLQIKKLYFPETINNIPVQELQWDYQSEKPHVFGISSDAAYFQEVHLPGNIQKVDDSVFQGFDNLYLVKSYAEELTVLSNTFANLRYLSVVDANIFFDEYSSSAFAFASLLQDVTLSSRNTIIPPSSFFSCKSLKNIELPSGLTTISSYAFSFSGLTAIALPDGLHEISNSAFSGSSIQQVYIPASVTNLGKAAFGGRKLEQISVSEDNTVYDSRDNCNAIIHTATNNLVIGSNQTVIPNSTKIIGGHAFINSGITSLNIPDGVETIEDEAFLWSDLYKVIIPESVSFIGEGNFVPISYYGHTKTIIYTYSDSYTHSYVVDKDLAYVLIDGNPDIPDIEYVMGWFGREQYQPFGSVDLSEYTVEVKYVGIDEIETISEFDRVIYPEGRDSFRSGDFVFSIVFHTAQGHYNLHTQFPAEIVGKATPEYTIPNDLVGSLNSLLSDVELPEGFEWEDGETILDELGTKVFDARFIPADQDNYEIIENIPVSVEVINKTLIKPIISVENKTYDGTSNLSLDLVSITVIDESDYSIQNTYLDASDAGSTTAHIVLRLSNDKFSNYSFANGLQEKDFTRNIEILRAPVARPTPPCPAGNTSILALSKKQSSMASIAKK